MPLQHHKNLLPPPHKIKNNAVVAFGGKKNATTAVWGEEKTPSLPEPRRQVPMKHALAPWLKIEEMAAATAVDGTAVAAAKGG